MTSKPKRYNSASETGYTYWQHVTDAASIESFERQRHSTTQPTDIDSRLSAEALPENSSLIDFKSFAHDYPEKLFPLLANLRPEFQEFFVEYYLLGKSQSFIGKTHGCIQTRIWQALRIIERAIGAFIVLGAEPGYDILHPILDQAGVEHTEFGSLTNMILYYAASRSYAVVASKAHAPVPAIRKIFRPIITTLLAGKDIKTVAAGAYLHNLTHQTSLTKTGLSKSSIRRIRRVKTLRFAAPPTDESPLVSFGAIQSLRDNPWCMLEISSEHRMEQLRPVLLTQGKRIFGKKPAQIFAPVNADGELEFGYIFARSISTAAVRALTHVRGISEMAGQCNDAGTCVRAVTVPNAEVQTMIDKYNPPTFAGVRVGNFVEIQSGDAARYCGTVTAITPTGRAVVKVTFPTGRYFVVKADKTSLKILQVSPEKRCFWGARN